MDFERDCPLCRAERKTKWYYADETCWIADCETCRVPMAVIRHHGPATEMEENLMASAIRYLFPDATIRKEPRKILGHIHWHIIGGRYLGI